MIEDLIKELESRFPMYNWRWNYDEPMKTHIVQVDDFDFYMYDDRFKKWRKVLSKKFKQIRVLYVYKKFKSTKR